MNQSLVPALVVAASLCLAGCATTTVRVDRVLHTPSQQLQDNSPSGRKVLVALASLRQFQTAQAQVRQQIESPWTNQTLMAVAPAPQAKPATNAEPTSTTAATIGGAAATATGTSLAFATSAKVTPVTNLAVALKNHLQAPLDSLAEQQAKVDAQIAVFCGFFENTNAIGMAPRIDWEIAKSIMLLDQQKTWVPSFVEQVWHSESPLVQEALRRAGGPTANNHQLTGALSNLTTQADLSISVAAREGFGGFRTVGVAEINASDPEYQMILNSRAANLSQDAISKSSSSIAGDAQVIIVQESPAQFRTYQISSDPTTLMKNISLLVAKATAAAAKYLSGGIAP
jgi:hypothetical protein